MKKITELIETGEEVNIELALLLLEGFGIDKREFLVNEYGNLLIWWNYNNIRLIDLYNPLDITRDLIEIFSIKSLGFRRYPRDFPSEISKLKKLEKIDLKGSFNSTYKFANQIGELTNLMWLDLSTNKLKEIPSWIQNLKNLQLLYLDHNYIKEIPSWINSMPSLEQIHLHNNDIKENPKNPKIFI